MKQNQRLQNIDALRGLACLGVLVGHAYGFQNLLPSDSVIFLLIRKIICQGHHAVTVFIAISGFCLMLPVLRNKGCLPFSTLEFFKRRVHRILPPYFAALILCAALLATFLNKPTLTLWDRALIEDPASYVSHFLLVHNLVPGHNYDFNFAFWSIAVEWQIYFVFPVLVILWSRWGAGALIFSAMIISIILNENLRFTPLLINPHGATPQSYFVFALGMLAAAVTKGATPTLLRLRSQFPWKVVVVFGAFAIFSEPLVRGGLKLYRKEPDAFWFDYAVGFWAFALLVWIQTVEIPRWLCRSWNLFAACGIFSYSLYLTHAPVLQIITQYILLPLGLTPGWTNLLLATIGPVAAIGFARLFFQFCEKPFLNPGKSERHVASPSPL